MVRKIPAQSWPAREELGWNSIENNVQYQHHWEVPQSDGFPYSWKPNIITYNDCIHSPNLND